MSKKNKVYLQIIADIDTPLAQVLNRLKESSVTRSGEAAQALINYFLLIRCEFIKVERDKDIPA